MVSIFYMVCVLISTINLVYLSMKRYKNTNRYIWTILLLIPIICLGYWVKSTVKSSEAAMTALCFIYLDSTVFPVVFLFAIIKSTGRDINPWAKFSAYAVTIFHIFTIWLNRNNTLYYSYVLIEETGLGTMTKTGEGPLKFTHYIYLGALIIGYAVVLIWGFFKAEKISKKNLAVYSLFSIFLFVVYFVEMLIDANFTSLPALYVLGSIIITANYEHIQSHDLFNLIGERQAKTGHRGYCAFDLQRCFLGCNKQFSEMMPDIQKVIVDEEIPKSYDWIYNQVNNAIDGFDEKGEYSEKIENGDKIYRVIVSDFSVSRTNKQNGYLLEMTDITEEQKRVDLIEKYNETLSKEVSAQTEHILDIQNSVVLGLADMVENRDDNTGGHVKRTSDVIKLLVNEVRRQGIYRIDEQKAKDIVRAAPTHDLGKITIDSNILCKPGRLTNEEFDIMKTHAPKSGEIVKIILAGVEEQHFVDVSYNIARHHHERWDGKGYPDGLLGESIPVEARIMAVADVYDALVSKRCYKEAMSFEQAAKIMNENMGSQFDPAMRPVFVACRRQLESYYSQQA